MEIGKLGITPGPWEWAVNRKSRHCALFGGSIGWGKETVMDFVRYGMQNAQPRFRDGHIMYKAETKAVPRKGDEHNAHWRADIDSIDAQLIAAAPEMLEALIDGLKMIESMTGFIDVDSNEYSFYLDSVEVIEKATGRKWAEVKELI